MAGGRTGFTDVFCGRVTASGLARHYTGYSPEVLKEIYEKANFGNSKVIAYKDLVKYKYTHKYT